MEPKSKPRTTLLSRALKNEWLRAFALALFLLLALHLFVIRVVSVGSTSMFATLRPDDLLLVARWPVWTGFARGDIVVFRDPLKDNEAMHRRPLLVKRIAAMPGEVLEIRKGVVHINGKPQLEGPGTTWSYLVRAKEGVVAAEVAARYGSPAERMDGARSTIEMALNPAMAKRVEADPQVVSVEAMRLATGERRHLFPFSPRYPWNGDDYGPITVPKKGDTLHVNVDNFALYDRIIGVYEDHTLGLTGNTITLDGDPLSEYVVEQDYYFVLGDSRHFSADSRYLGFLPSDHLVGRGSTILVPDR